MAGFYRALFSSERGHYRVFLKLAYKVGVPDAVEERWKWMLESEARILAKQAPGAGIHSGAG
jgi:tRNA-(ms[2]io[6]A)-hydroxylase